MNLNLNKKQSINFSKMSKNEKNAYIKNIIMNSTKIKFPTNESESKLYQYKFWNNQPCIKNENEMVFSKPIYEKLEKTIISEDLLGKFNISYSCLKDISTDNEFINFSKFLNSQMNDDKKLINYVYNEDYLNLILGNNNVIIYIKYNNKICGTIACSISNFRIGDKVAELACVKLLCLDKNIRNNRYSETLINLLKNTLIDKDIHYGIFLTNRYVPIPNSKIELCYRPLNYSKLYSCDFYKITDKKNEKKAHEYNLNKYSLKNNKLNIVAIDNTNMEKVYNLYCSYMEKFYLYKMYTFNEFSDFLNLKNNCSYGILDKDKNIIDFFVFGKCLLKYTKHDINCAVLLLYSNNSIEYTPTNIINYVAQTAFNNNLDIMLLYNNFENSETLNEVDGCYLKTNILNYINLYNWQYIKLKENQIGFI